MPMTTADQTLTDPVCLVDDDAAVLKSISRLLASDGFEVCAFDEPKSFLAHSLTHRVPVVVLDVWMNDMDGLEAQEMVSVLSPGTRVIIITGGEDEKTKDAGQRQDRARTADRKAPARQHTIPVLEQHLDPNINSTATIVTHCFQTFCHQKRLQEATPG